MAGTEYTVYDELVESVSIIKQQLATLIEEQAKLKHNIEVLQHKYNIHDPTPSVNIKPR